MKPLLIYDVDCGFCRRWVHRWQGRTGEAVDYAPYQQVGDQFEQIKPEAFEQAVQLVESDGTVYSGAQAVFRLMAHAPRGGACFWVWTPGAVGRHFFRQGGAGGLGCALWRALGGVGVRENALCDVRSFDGH